jgi:hypothetical protein
MEKLRAGQSSRQLFLSVKMWVEKEGNKDED